MCKNLGPQETVAWSVGAHFRTIRESIKALAALDEGVNSWTVESSPYENFIGRRVATSQG